MLEPRSAFLSLPQELRDYIYEYLLITTFLVKVPHTGGISSCLQLHQHTHLAILNVSRSTYEEAKRVLYRDGQFRFDIFSADSPPLHKDINNMQAITNLQDIILRLNVCEALKIGYNRLDIVRFATMRINYFAKSNPGVPRIRCVVEFGSILDVNYLMESPRAVEAFKDALGHLTGFKLWR